MFLHQHPYPPFIKNDTEKLIIGTIPPPRFSTGNLLEKDVNFSYGSYYNSLWLYLNKIYNLDLHFNNSKEAINQRKQFLVKHKVGICDIVASAQRNQIDASDNGLTQIKLRNVLAYIRRYPSIHTILFMGGNSKNGPEYLFRKHLKSFNMPLKCITTDSPRVHQITIPLESLTSGDKKEKDASAATGRIIKTVSLISPSGLANRAIGSMTLYKKLKAENLGFTTFDFRLLQYAKYI